MSQQDPLPPACTHLDVLQEDASSPLVLEGQQLLGVLPLLVAVLLEEVGEASEGHVVAGEVEGLRGDKEEEEEDRGTKTVIRETPPKRLGQTVVRQRSGT